MQFVFYEKESAFGIKSLLKRKEKTRLSITCDSRYSKHVSCLSDFQNITCFEYHLLQVIFGHP